MKAREKAKTYHLPPQKFNVKFQSREEKGVRFLIIILQELRVQAEIIDFGRNASKVLLSVRKLEEREVCLRTKQKQQQIRQK